MEKLAISVLADGRLHPAPWRVHSEKDWWRRANERRQATRNLVWINAANFVALNSFVGATSSVILDQALYELSRVAALQKPT